MNQQKILICGGHPAPAIAIIEKLLEKREANTLIYIGKKFSEYISSSKSWEYQEITKLGIKFHDFRGGKLYRNISISNIFSLFKIPLGFIQAFHSLITEKPDIVISFGGYIALPHVLCAQVLGIPALTHEQTSKIGLTNRIISTFANTFCVSWPINLKQIRHQRLILTGNPLRSVFKKEISTNTLNIKLENLPLLYITGGGLGSHAINDLIGSIINELLENFLVVHQSGNIEEFRDYEKLDTIRKNLPDKLKKRYFLFKHIDAGNVNWILRHAQLVVGRSGANTITEVLYTHTPAIFIPLPHSGENEQKENAQMLVHLGVAKMLEQDKADGRRLLAVINKMLTTLPQYKNQFTHQTNSLVSLPSTDLIIKEIETLLRE